MRLTRISGSLAALALALLPLGAHAQAPKLPRIGVLSTLPASFAAPYVEAGRADLRDAGEYRFAEESLDKLQAQAAELVGLRNRARIIEFAARDRLPATYEVREFVNDGGLTARAIGLTIPQSILVRADTLVR